MLLEIFKKCFPPSFVQIFSVGSYSVKIDGAVGPPLWMALRMNVKLDSVIQQHTPVFLDAKYLLGLTLIAINIKPWIKALFLFWYSNRQAINKSKIISIPQLL